MAKRNFSRCVLWTRLILCVGNSGEITEAVIDEAKKGGYLPAKFLLEAVGLRETAPAEEKAPEKTESSGTAIAGAVEAEATSAGR